MKKLLFYSTPRVGSSQVHETKQLDNELSEALSHKSFFPQAVCQVTSSEMQGVAGTEESSDNTQLVD